MEAFKTKAGTLETERDGLTTQLEEFKGLDVEGIKKATEEWKQKAEQAEKDSAAKIVIQKFC
ncbi:MAG: hypothetical protein RR716_05305 [Christensenellaceae bacterium]